MNQQGSNADADFAIRRALTGLCSIGLLIGWGAVLYFGDQDKADTIAPVLMRLGLVTGALWLALPEVRALFKNVSGKGVLLFGVALVAAATSKASVVPLTLLGGGLLVVFGARRAWQWHRRLLKYGRVYRSSGPVVLNPYRPVCPGGLSP